jgi:hypothetical protein
VGVKDNGAGGKRRRIQARGCEEVPSQLKDLHKAMSRGKGQRTAADLPGEEAEEVSPSDSAKVQKFGWGGERGAQRMERRERHQRFPEGRRQREAREARGTSRNPLGNQRDGTEGRREARGGEGG